MGYINNIFYKMIVSAYRRQRESMNIKHGMTCLKLGVFVMLDYAALFHSGWRQQICLNLSIIFEYCIANQVFRLQ